MAIKLFSYIIAEHVWLTQMLNHLEFKAEVSQTGGL